MSKLTKSESARFNGAKSRGAVTPQDRVNSSVSAARHCKALDKIRLMRKLQNDPTEPPKSTLNGEYQLLNGAPEGEEPTIEPGAQPLAPSVSAGVLWDAGAPWSAGTL